jgi:hypothetical protein
MILSFDLSPDSSARVLQAAEHEGVDPETIILRLVTEFLEREAAAINTDNLPATVEGHVSL